MKEEFAVWWVRNPPSIAIYYPVKNPEEALEVFDRLAREDMENPDIESNAGGLQVSNDTDNLGGTEWYDEDGNSISDLWDMSQESSEEDSEEE